MPKHRPTDELKDIVYIDHYFNDWDADTKNLTFAQEGIYSRLRSLYFKNSGKNNGKIANNFELLCFRIGCHTDDERADLAWVLKDKFKIVNKSYRQKAWDEHIKNIRFKMGKTDNAGERSNGKSNGSNGSGVTPSNDKSNDGHNTHIYDNTGGFVMTGAERTEKSRKLKALKNKGIQTDKSMTLDDIRGLYDTHFNPCNAGSNATDVIPCNDNCNASSNASNAQIGENNHNPLTITQEQEKNECVNSEALHAPTHTNFSKKLKSIGEWQAPTLDAVNQLLKASGFDRVLTQAEFTDIFTKFKNYNVSRELQGHFLATEQVRIDKLMDWIKREKPTFNTPTPANDDNGFGSVWTDTKPPTPKPNTFNIGTGKWLDCFEGYNPMECIAIVKEFRLVGETSLEAYERIKSAGVENCQKPQTANPEFVSQILSNYKPQRVMR